ncbi:hypothetical protein BBJ29_005279 [Phytophthora kernoviae]|uniref:Uncharacterized protein n=1 Tax=Phytophthora kernoviae TaxID=325452 RepID=A0A3F2RZ79_9STRA|nr:hypothetical protein BBJ29_005279 [Phytophthora kernoviae]RLN67206.1 hypothetical protein BBP00_00001744 [Phytophthora kernoviae]
MTPSSPTLSSVQGSRLPRRLSSSSVQASQRSWTWAPIDPANSHLRWVRRPLSPNRACDRTLESSQPITPHHGSRKTTSIDDADEINGSCGSNTSQTAATTALAVLTTTQSCHDDLAIVVYDGARARVANDGIQNGQLDDEDVNKDDTVATPVVYVDSDPNDVEQQRPRLPNRLQIKPVHPRVYEHNAKRQQQGAAGRARWQALEDKAATKTTKAIKTIKAIKTTMTATTIEAAPYRSPFAPRTAAQTKPANSVASRLFDYLKDPRYLVHRAKCKLRRSEAEIRRR